MKQNSRVTILVKASPQPSKRHQETVCCAGLDPNGNWKRLFPVRFRQLSDDQSFKRWNIVDFEYSRPSHDARSESCRVHEESISVVGHVSNVEKRTELVSPIIVASEIEAHSLGHSLAAIRPTEIEFISRRRQESEIEEARQAFESQARQALMFDKELDAIEPCPYEFKMRFLDGDGKRREKQCGDWETHAAFFKLRRDYGEEGTIGHLRRTYCEKYVQSGIVFALGNMASRPKTWQLLGIFPIKQSRQTSLFGHA